MSWVYFQEDWSYNHLVTFDGVNRRIYISTNVTQLDVKEDLYSSWKEWTRIRDNAKYHAAFRNIGGDPVGNGLYAGDIYFLINNWQIVVDHSISLVGTLYQDNNLSPYIIMPGGGVTAVTSNLAYAYNTSGVTVPTAQEIRQEIDDNSVKLADIKNTVDALPSSSTIAEDVWNYNLRDLTTTMTPEEFWNFVINVPMTPGSAGEKLKQLLTTSNFIALK